MHRFSKFFDLLRPHLKSIILIFSTFGSVFIYIFSRLLIQKPDGVYIGQPNSWSDWVVHISITQIFANKPISEWFLYHPFFAHGKLTYGFLIHLITALFMRVGFSLESAFFIVSVLLLLIFLLGLYFLYYIVSGSKKETVLGIFIFFTSSGMGVFRYLSTLTTHDLVFPTIDYSRFPEYEWLAGNIPAAMLIPQRAFFIGVSIGVWVLNLLLLGLKQSTKNKQSSQLKKRFFLAGVLAGTLPVAHMHSFIVIVITTGIICIVSTAKFQLKQTQPQIKKMVRQNKQLSFKLDLIKLKLLCTYYVLPATLLSSILYVTFIHGGIEIDNFMTISLGWTVPRQENSIRTIIAWLVMWLKLWGTFLPTSIFSFWLLITNTDNTNKKTTRHSISLAYYIGFFIVFILANIIIFQPTKWDNTKLFAWVYLGLSILVSKLIFKLIHTSLLQKILAFFILISLSTTGTIELLRILNFNNNTYLLSSTSEIKLAKLISENTKTDAVFLTGTAHNHPIPLWAQRPIYVGYLGWVRNFGFDHTIRDLQIHHVFSGTSDANSIIKNNEISYVYVGSNEKSSYSINYTYLNQFPIAFQNENTIVYDTRQLWQ